MIISVNDNMKPVTKKSEIPAGTHLAILVFKTSSIYHEGDERSRTCPGHGYPAYTETIYTVDYIPFADEKGVNDWIVNKELNKKPYGENEPYQVIRSTPLVTELTTSVKFK